MAYGLAQEGANVAITYATSGESALSIVQDIEDKYKVTCRAYAMHVTDANQVQGTLAKIHDDFKSIDVFVANAGISRQGNAEVKQRSYKALKLTILLDL
jgi:sorbose reductase